jgi:aryl-alcohol dehydrogenase-like predicted oxidoreductase
MEISALGESGIRVSRICLGTMTWGQQNTEPEGHAQMDRAVDAGVNVFDAAEMYPVPNSAKTCGRTEEIIGTWLAARPGMRERIVLATKVSGPGNLAVSRGGMAALDRANIRLAIDASLRRLRTDHVDLYQVHWPARSTNTFGCLGYVHRDGDEATAIAETLDAMGELVAEGKVRAVGISNEVPWGVAEYLRLGRAGAVRIASIQNPYSLLNRSFEVGLAEQVIRERVGMLAYSPLAFGMLTGKYADGRKPEGARLTLTLFEGFQRYQSAQGRAAAAAYVQVAEEAGLNPAQMALAYVHTRPFVTSTIIGATTIGQLDTNLASLDVKLSDDVLAAIEDVHRTYTYPSP